MKGAKDFAERGIDQIWFALFPTACEERIVEIKTVNVVGPNQQLLEPRFRAIWEKEEIKKVKEMSAKKLEDKLIPVVRRWNRQNERADILNRR